MDLAQVNVAHRPTFLRADGLRSFLRIHIPKVRVFIASLLLLTAPFESDAADGGAAKEEAFSPELQALRDAEKKAVAAYRVASNIRNRSDIIDPDPEAGQTKPTSSKGDDSELLTYITAKNFYLKAKQKVTEARRTLDRARHDQSPKR
jgi:hypothetical protein